MRSQTILAAASAVALAACATGPNYVAKPIPSSAAGPFTAASGSSVVSDAQPTAKWWRLYDDPVVDQLVAAALASNTDLRVAAANLARSRAEVEFANRQGGFSGKTSAAFQRAQESAEQYLLTEKIPVVNEGALDLSISYEIDLFGKLNSEGATIIVVTHDEDLAKAAKRRIHMRDGLIVDG